MKYKTMRQYQEGGFFGGSNSMGTRRLLDRIGFRRDVKTAQEELKEQVRKVKNRTGLLGLADMAIQGISKAVLPPVIGNVVGSLTSDALKRSLPRVTTGDSPTGYMQSDFETLSDYEKSQGTDSLNRALGAGASGLVKFAGDKVGGLKGIKDRLKLLNLESKPMPELTTGFGVASVPMNLTGQPLPFSRADRLRFKDVVPMNLNEFEDMYNLNTSAIMEDELPVPTTGAQFTQFLRFLDSQKEGGSVRKKLKPIPEGNKGLSKLPEKVRNRMGYMQDGGEVQDNTATNIMNLLALSDMAERTPQYSMFDAGSRGGVFSEEDILGISEGNFIPVAGILNKGYAGIFGSGDVTLSKIKKLLMSDRFNRGGEGSMLRQLSKQSPTMSDFVRNLSRTGDEELADRYARKLIKEAKDVYKKSYQDGGMMDNYMGGGMMDNYMGGGLLNMMPYARRIV